MSNFNGMTKAQWSKARKAVYDKYKDQGGRLVCVSPDGGTSIRVICEYSESGDKRIDVGNITDFA